MIDFDFNRYSVEDLRDLNHRLVEHLRLRHQRDSQRKMDDFDLGETVCFKTRDGSIVEAKIISFNQKTITVERTTCGHRWRVSPHLLEKVVVQKKSNENVVAIGTFNKAGVQGNSKFSRNAPCPCGSGKKFKRCCIARFKEMERLGVSAH